jgi:hypothetical protein
MNPNSSSEIPAMQLPPPMDQAPSTAPTGAEKAPAAPETAAPKANAFPVASVPLPAPAAVPAGQPAILPAVAAATGTNLTVKDDGDLIEKEWVNKAKQIVERTREDPYKQSEELTIFKADYMKQRYNKTIKLK